MSTDLDLWTQPGDRMYPHPHARTEGGAARRMIDLVGVDCVDDLEGAEEPCWHHRRSDDEDGDDRAMRWAPGDQIVRFGGS